MIKTIAQLLEKIKQKEEQVLQEYGIIKHGPLIGDMYEGLTRELLSKSVFNDLDLRVVSGKVKNHNREFSDQIDCMIVVGDGEEIPYTGKYLYDINQVIAVIEVKKNLYASDFEGAYYNLLSVYNLHTTNNVPHNLLRDAYKGIILEELPRRDEIDLLPLQKQMLYHALVVEASLPLRIVFGYNGYRSEKSLREAFKEFLLQNMSNDLNNKRMGFGPTAFPNLVICEDKTIVKLNGMPYRGQIGEDLFTPILASSNKNPILILLEVIWTRLHYIYNIDASIFGEDLSTEALSLMLSCRIIEKEGHRGWEYIFHELDDEFLSQDVDASWNPAELDEIESIIVHLLCEGSLINVNDEFFLNLLVEYSTSSDLVIESLKNKELANVDRNGNIYLLTDGCQVAILPDGRIVAAENKTGRLSRWLLKFMEKRKQ